MPVRVKQTLDPIWDDSDLLNEFVDEIMDDLTRDIRNLYLTYTTDVVSGQMKYCMPPLLEIDEARITYADGTYSGLAIKRMDDLRALFGPIWRDNPATGSPLVLATEGVNDYLIYPQPNYNAASGLRIVGWGTYDPTSWQNETDTCPLPRQAQIAVTLGVVMKMLGGTPVEANAERSYKKAKAQFWTETATITRATAHKSNEIGNYTADFNPLNM